MQVVKKEQIQFLDILLDLLYLHVFGSNLIPVEQSILFLHLHSQRSGSQKRSQGRLLHSASYNIHTKVAVTIEEDQVRYFDILVYFHKIKNKNAIEEIEIRCIPDFCLCTHICRGQTHNIVDHCNAAKNNKRMQESMYLCRKYDICVEHIHLTW